MLENIINKIREVLDEKDQVRENALKITRETVRLSAEAIRAIHRGELENAKSIIKDVKKKLEDLATKLKEHPDIYFSGYVYSAYQEYVEAAVLLSILEGSKIPSPEDLNAPYVPYLLGLGDVVGELRRQILDAIRKDQLDQGEFFLEIIEEIYEVLSTLGYPNAIVPGLRHKCDVARNILEKTRGDLTNAIHRNRLLKGIQSLMEKLNV
ncbi:MAG: haloacid dehalogenase [Candidatus Baldrarchaeia archaeon]